MFKLFSYLRPYKWQIAVILIFLFLQAISTLYLPNLMSRIVDIGVVHGRVGYILEMGGLMLLVSIGSVLCSMVAGWSAARTASGFGRTLRRDVFRKVESFSMHEFDQIGTASLITRTTNDITQVQQFVNMMLRLMVRAPLMCIGGIIMAVWTDPGLSLVIVIVLPLLALAILLIMRRGIHLFRTLQKKIDKLNRVLREGLSGIRVIRSFNRVQYEQERFKEANLDLTETAVRAQQIMAGMQPLSMLIVNMATVAIIWFGGIRMASGGIQVGTLMAFLQYVMQILMAVMMVSMMFFMIPRASASAARIQEVLEVDPDVRDRDGATHFRGDEPVVRFEHVTFSYPGAEEPALCDISFTARPGQMTAIIGGTGAGKSTLVNLIPRFYDVSEGSITVGGVDIRDVPQSELRAKIGFVPQKAVLFSGTVGDNVRFGKENAADGDVAAAVATAQAAEFIASLTDGFEAMVKQGGTNLSGGQKQRMAIARALVRQPDVYIFDDSFSALDFRTDARLRAALAKEIEGRVVFIVAQRVNTVMHADQLIVLDAGQIAGIGRHEELLQSCETYRQVVESQLTEEEIG